MANIEATIQKLAQGFVQEVVRALVSSSIEEFAQLAGGKGGGGGGRTRTAPAARTAAPAATGRGRGSKAASEGRTERRSGGDKRARRSADEIQTITTKAVSFIRDNAGDENNEGVSISDIAKHLRLDVEDVTRPVHLAVKAGFLKKKGEKRMTRYFPGKKEMKEG